VKSFFGLNIASAVHVAAASTIFWDLWNGDTSKLVRVRSILHLPDQVTAIATGVGFNFKLARTTAIGTTGTAQTPWPVDTGRALDSDITARLKPGGGATAGTTLRTYTVHGEETDTYGKLAAAVGGQELIPPWLRELDGLLIRPGTGISVIQETNSNLGQSSFFVGFSVED
jgi:hypothetical protein